MTTIQTQNTQWGYFGTMKSNYGISDKMAATLFDLAAQKIKAKVRCSDEAAREFLDATH